MNRNWDWEEIGRDMKADEEKRMARKKAEEENKNIAASKIAASKTAAINTAAVLTAYDQSIAAAEEISHEPLTVKEAANPRGASTSRTHSILREPSASRTRRSDEKNAYDRQGGERIKRVVTPENEGKKEAPSDAAIDIETLVDNTDGNVMRKEKLRASESSAERSRSGDAQKRSEERSHSGEKQVGERSRAAEEHRRARNERYYQDPRRRGTHNGKKKRRKKRKKKSKLFRNLLLIYVTVLIVLAVFAVRDVYKTMVEMRDNDPEMLVRDHLQSLSDQEIAGLFESNPKYEDPGVALANLRDYVNSGELTIKKAGKNEYEVFRGEQKLFLAELATVETKSKYLILNYDLLEFQSLQPVTEGELYHYEITAPSSYQITVNGRDIGEPIKSVPQDGFADVKNFVTLPSTNTFVLDHLTKVPDIRVTENGMDVSFSMAEKMDLAEDFKQSHTFANMEDAGIEFDALGFAEQWDLFMTDDLPGGTHGYYQLEPYFIEGTSMQKKAFQWATDIDITLTSTHTLDDPPLTNQRISDIIVYDENTVSYEAYIEKIMHITRTGEEKLEKFASTIYLVRYEGEWKVANIRGDVGME